MLASVDRARRVERRLAFVSRPQERVLAAAYGASLPRVAKRSWSWLSAPGSGLSVALLLLVAKRQGLSRKTLEGWHKASQ